jgi:hypothetical protein
MARTLDTVLQHFKPAYNKIFHRKARIEAEAKYYSLTKRGKGQDTKRYQPRRRLRLGFLSI